MRLWPLAYYVSPGVGNDYYYSPGGRGVAANKAKLRDILVLSSVFLGTGLVFLSPIPAGCHSQHHWSLMAMFAILLGAVALTVRGFDQKPRPRIDPVLVALGGLTVVTLFQLVPLPTRLVGVISPARLGLAHQVADATGDACPASIPLTACLKCTRDSLLLLVAYVSAFYAASVVFAAGRRWKLLFGAAVACASVLSVYGFTQVLANRGTRLTSTFVNSSRFAALMAISGACAVGLFIAEGGQHRRESLSGGFRFPPGTVWLIAAVVIETALVLTLSRLGIASALLAGLLTLAVFTGRRSVWAATTAVLLVLAANASLAADSILARYSVLFGSDLGGLGRPQCWRMSLPLALDFPVFGSGAGTFKHVFRLYQDPSLPGWWTFAHNDYLNLFCDMGLLGFTAVMAATAFALKRIVQLRSSENRSTRSVAVAGFLGFSTVLLHSTADFPLQEPAVGLLFFMLAGVAYGRGAERAEGREESPAPHRPDLRGSRPAGPPHRWIFLTRLGAALALCAVALPLLVRLHLSGKLTEEASRIAVGRDEEVKGSELLRRVALLSRAAEIDTWDATARYEAARTRVRLIAEGAYADGVQTAVLKARHELHEGRLRSPFDPRPYYLDAVLSWRPDAAEHPDRMMLFALKMAPAWHDVAYQVGGYFLMRWRRARYAGNTFGLVRWQGLFGEGDELFKHTANSLSFAARSPRGREATARLVLDHGLSSGETDAILSPDAEINLALARGLAERGDHEGAAVRYARALGSGGLSPPLHGVHVSYARSLLEMGRREAALKQYDNALRASPRGELTGTIRALGMLRAAPEDAVAVADYWASVSERMREEPAVLLALAQAELAAGRDEPGFKHLLEYANETKDAAAFAELACFAQSRGELKLAASLAAEATRLDPQRASYHTLLAGILRRLGRDDHAAAVFERVLLLDPRDLDAARALAAIKVKAKRYPRAISVWREFIDVGGDAAAAHEALADVYLGLLDRDRAEEELEKAVEAKPGDVRLRKKLDEIRP